MFRVWLVATREAAGHQPLSFNVQKQNKIVSNCYETFRKEYNGGLDSVPIM